MAESTTDSTPLLSSNDEEQQLPPSVEETGQPCEHPHHHPLVVSKTCPSSSGPLKDDNSTAAQYNTQQDHDSKLSTVLVRINDKISDYQLGLFKVAVSTQSVCLLSLENDSRCFTDVFVLLEQRIQNQAVSFTVEVLERLGLPKDLVDLLRGHVKDQFSFNNEILLDMLLTLGEVLSNMTDSVYCNFRELAQRDVLGRFSSDRLKRRENMVSILLQRDFLESEHLEKYFHWTSHAGAKNQVEKLKKFCYRHGKNVPEPWSVELDDKVGTVKTSQHPVPIECTDEGDDVDGSVAMARSMPEVVSRDGPTKEDSTPQMSETEKKEPNPQYQLNPSEEAQESRVKSVFVSKQPPKQLHLHTVGESGDKDNERRSLTENSDPAPAAYGSMTSLPFNQQPQPMMMTTASSIQRTDSPPPEATTLNPMIHEIPDSTQKPSLTRWQLICCICSFLISISLAVVLFSGWMGYSSANHLLNLLAPPMMTGRVGSNTTNLLGCFSPSTTRSVLIKEGSMGSLEQYDADLYSQMESQLKIVRTRLNPKDRSFNVSDGDVNVPVSYYYDDIPLYVASNGNITLLVSFVAHHSDTDTLLCGIRFFLFSSKNGYDRFLLDTKDVHPQNTQMSTCITVRSIPNTTTCHFDIQTEGFYYLAVSIKNTVELHLTISADLSSYGVSNIPDEPCTLDDVKTKCRIIINSDRGIPGISHENVCILSSSSMTVNNVVNITVSTVDVNVSSLLFIVFWAPLLFIGLLIIMIIFIRCICVKFR